MWLCEEVSRVYLCYHLNQGWLCHLKKKKLREETKIRVVVLCDVIEAMN